ncbi:hypothetical protein [Deinococcus sp.]|uniref:hypothetical protein n=1 Tax=Deinococcus sp. TaxID=47478 RepID=UPI003C7D3273
MTTMQQLGLGLIVAPRGRRTKAVSLDPGRVSQVTADVDQAELVAWLGLSAEPQETPETENVKAERLLVLAQTAFEQGMYAEAEARALRVLPLGPSPVQHLRALALVAWVRTVNAPHAQGWAAVKALQAQLKVFQEQARQEGTRLDTAAEALVWLQTARFYVRKHKTRLAREAYARAARHLSPTQYRELGVIESGLGYLAQQSGQLDEAERRYRAALELYSKGRWPWAMHVQYNNLAAVCFNLHAQLEDADPAAALAHLEEAVRWSEDALEFAKEMDYGGAVDLEVNMAYAMRLMGRFERAAHWIRRAENIASTSESASDLACTYAERAELEEALGQREAAMASMRGAVRLLRQVGSDAWTLAAQKRLEELEGQRPLGKPLKLW